MKKGLLIALGVVLVGGFFGYDYYQRLFAPNTPDVLVDEYVLIPTNSTFDEVLEMLDKNGTIKNKESFKWVAEYMSYPKNPMRAGRFKIKPNMSNKSLVTLLRSGEQAPVRLAIHNKWTVEQVAGLVAKQLELDSVDFARTFLDEAYLSQFGLVKETAMTAFIPDSYDVYWNTTTEDFFKKMIFYRDKFWSEDRLAKAKKLGLTKEEVYTLASIVEKETNQNDEKSRIAGVYLNRIDKGWTLGADPTVKFAVGDFKLSRILFSHTDIVSPYNTYKVAGLPPGPIYMSSKASIDHSLDAEKHNYMYFCAEPGGTGHHAFAVTAAQHKANAAKYHAYSREQRRRSE